MNPSGRRLAGPEPSPTAARARPSTTIRNCHPGHEEGRDEEGDDAHEHGDATRAEAATEREHERDHDRNGERHEAPCQRGEQALALPVRQLEEIDEREPDAFEDRVGAAIGRDAASELTRLDEVDGVPERAGDETARAGERQRRPASSRLAREHEEHERGQREDECPLRSHRQSERERGEPEVGTRRPHGEVGTDHEERGDHQVVESGRSLERDHGEGRERQPPESSRGATQPEAPRDSEYRDARGDDREQLDEPDEAVSSAPDHRHRRLDLGARREDVDPLVRGVRDEAHRVLLLPERCPRKVVEHRVREALRYRERDDDEVSVEGGREGGEQRHGAIAERFARGRSERRRGSDAGVRAAATLPARART